MTYLDLPEDSLIVPVTTEEMSGYSYEFDLIDVLFDKDKSEFLWASDKGCSCPTPFDGISLDDYSRGDWQELKSALHERYPDKDMAVHEILMKADKFLVADGAIYVF